METREELLNEGLDPDQVDKMLECDHSFGEMYVMNGTVDPNPITNKFGELPKTNVSKKQVCTKCQYGFWK